jgi:hypothetical protein
MKAIMLTFDKYKVFANHTIATYETLWPDNPLVFMIPYQEENTRNFYISKYGEKVELVKTKPGIKETMDTLLSNFVDENCWVYWCMDDRYVIDINKNEYNKVYSWVNSINDPRIASVKCISRPGADAPDHLNYFKGKIRNEFNQVFFQRKTYSMIWIHQFIRIKALKDVFSMIPNDLKSAIEMDNIVNSAKLPKSYKFFSLSKSILTLGESTTRGKITENCYKNLIEYKIAVPKEFERSDEVIISGNTKTLLFKTIFYSKWLIKYLMKKIKIYG